MNIKIVEMTNYEIAKTKYKDFCELVKKHNDSSLIKLAEELIKADIILNKWYFDGSYHQNGEFGTYIFEESDGERYVWMVSLRHFGKLMAESWDRIDKKNNHNYMDFYIGLSSEHRLFHVPSSSTEFMLKNNLDYETINCTKCGKPITQSEYCINFGYCDECMSNDFEEYLKGKEKSGS